jgi:hypothetical protein
MAPNIAVSQKTAVSGRIQQQPAAFRRKLHNFASLICRFLPACEKNILLVKKRLLFPEMVLE